MEQDRFAHNHTLFIVCMLCLLSSLSLLAFSLYLLPYTLWGYAYDLPDFVFTWQVWFIENYAFSKEKANTLIFFIPFGLGIVTGFIAYLSSNKIENSIYSYEEEPSLSSEKVEQDASLKASFVFGLKLFAAIVAVILIVFFVEWIIST